MNRVELRARRIVDRVAVRAALVRGGNRADDPVFVLCTGRTGSHLLVDYLDSLPDVAFRREILNEADPIGISHDRPRPVIERHVRRAVRSIKAAIPGAKLLLDQLAHAGLSLDDLRLMFPGVRFLLLYRESLGEQYVSARIARITSRWVADPGAPPFLGQIVIDPSELQAFFLEIRGLYEEVLGHAWARDRMVALTYEELVGDPVGLFRDRICPFLAIPPAPVSTRRTKQNPRSLQDVVANFGEVEGLLGSADGRLRFDP